MKRHKPRNKLVTYREETQQVLEEADRLIEKTLSLIRECDEYLASLERDDEQKTEVG